MIPRLPFWRCLLIGAIEEGDDLAARAGRIRAERRGRGALGHIVCNGPQNRIRVERIGRNVGERIVRAGGGLVQGTMQEGDALAA